LVVLNLAAVRPSALSMVVVVAVGAVVTSLLIWTLWKSGAAAFATAVGVAFFLMDVPWTFDFGRWYAWRCWFVVAVVLALAHWGFRNVLGRQAMFPADALDA
jgi:hypothetical protein